MTSDRQQLAEYQAALLDILAMASSPEAATESIRELTDTSPAPGYICEFDIRMVDAAMELTRKWGVPKQAEDVTRGQALSEKPNE
jgi:hypothetical protein